MNHILYVVLQVPLCPQVGPSEQAAVLGRNDPLLVEVLYWEKPTQLVHALPHQKLCDCSKELLLGTWGDRSLFMNRGLEGFAEEISKEY